MKYKIFCEACECEACDCGWGNHIVLLKFGGATVSTGYTFDVVVHAGKIRP